MIVLGPRDAEPGGAPEHWREGYWRPDTLFRGPQGCQFTAIPFDKCDAVFEYDARMQRRPMPEEQGWEAGGSDTSPWQHDPQHGVLRYDSQGSGPSFWRAGAQIERIPERGAAYGLFWIDRPSRDSREPGLDFAFEAQPRDGRPRGMRGCFSSLWHWRALDDSDIRPLIRAAAEPEMTQVWHRFGMDAELTGAETAQDDLDRDDGGKTIGSLDGLISNEDRGIFGYGNRNEAPVAARFGLTQEHRGLAGMVRNYVASFPGTFLRPSFRAMAMTETTLLRLLFCRAPGEDDRGAVFRVNYTSPSLGMRDNMLPEIEAPEALLIFDSGAPGTAAEISVPLENLRPGEPIRFTVERNWRHDEDRLRATAFLVSLILEEAP